MAITKIYKGTAELTNVLKIYKGSELLWEKQTIQNYVRFVSDSPRTITPKYTNSGITLQYSIDSGTTWTNISSGGTTASSDEIWFRGSATGKKSLNAYKGTSLGWVFSGTSGNKLYVYGNLMYLLCSNLGDEVAPTTLDSYGFQSMFYNCSMLVTPPELSATTLSGQSHYYKMFSGCTSLTTPPQLPAITVGYESYSDMFENCTALTTPPSLPATTLADYCYSRMFYDCTSLTTVPNLPATTLDYYYCYAAMFYGCTSLKVSSSLTGLYQYAWRLPTSGMGTTGEPWSVNMLGNTGGTFKSDPTINTTYFVQNPPV